MHSRKGLIDGEEDEFSDDSTWDQFIEILSKHIIKFYHPNKTSFKWVMWAEYNVMLFSFTILYFRFSEIQLIVEILYLNKVE